jgi:hypothetical protein
MDKIVQSEIVICRVTNIIINLSIFLYFLKKKICLNNDKLNNISRAIYSNLTINPDNKHIILLILYHNYDIITI